MTDEQPPAPPRPRIRSYASVRAPRGGFPLEGLRLIRLWRNRDANLSAHVGRLVDQAAELKRRVHDWGGLHVSGLDVLDIGPGQVLAQMTAMAVDNNVIGIDLDVVPWGWGPRQYVRILRENGPKRLVKTVARKVLGYDRKFRREMARRLGLREAPRPKVLQMDATRTSFADASFHLVYSFDTFEHVADPAAVLREVARILRPGGGCYISLHPITAEDGFHDLRIIAGDRASIPYWAHLRPELRSSVFASTYLNGIRLDGWKEIFDEEMPGVRLHLDMVSEPSYAAELDRIRAAGELQDYSDQELLVSRLVAFWKKAAPAVRSDR